MNRFPQSILLEVAMVSHSTFTSWRKRNGLLPREDVPGKWNYWTLADISVARTMVVLVNNGLSADRAASLASAARNFFKRACELDAGGLISEPYWLFSDGRIVKGNHDSTSHQMFKGENGVGECAIFINLASILVHTMARIQQLEGMRYELKGGPKQAPHPSFVPGDVESKSDAA